MGNLELNKRRILLGMSRFAKELSESKIPQLYELGHYLADNLISKISMLIGIENEIEFEYTSKSGKKRTRDFKWLFENILVEVYPSVPDFSEVKELHEKRNVYQHDSFAIDHHFNQQYALDYIKILEEILSEIGIIENKDNIIPTNFIGEKSVEVQQMEKSEALEKGDLNKLYRMISHEIEFSKGELISLTRDLGKYNINKYLDLEFGDSGDMIILRNESYVVIIYGPGIPKIGNFEINNLGVTENNKYMDDKENFGNVKIYQDFLNYLKEKLGLNS